MIAKTAKIKSNDVSLDQIDQAFDAHSLLVFTRKYSCQPCSIPPPKTAKLTCVKCEVVDFRGGRSRT